MTIPLRQAAPLPVTIEAHGATHPGQRREHNEDAHGLFDEARLYVVADGMGGHGGGDVASRITVDELARFFQAQRQDPYGRPWPFPPQRKVALGWNLLRVGIQVANQRVAAQRQTDPALARMGSTVAAVAIGESRVYVAHAGDCRVYRLRDGALARLTRDHTVREDVRVAQPDITEEEIAAIPQRDLVTRAVGVADEIDPAVATHDLARGDLFLICCDGLWGPVDEQTLADVLIGTPDLGQACAALIDLANDAGGPDNVTAVLVRVS
jgi:protein phosphatase